MKIKIPTIIITSIITILIILFVLSGDISKPTPEHNIISSSSIINQSRLDNYIKVKYGHLLKKARYAKRDLKCLSMNIYYEARNQSIRGQQAVADVTLNRVKHKRWPNTVCGVVYQRMQFSWTINGRHYTPRDKDAWKQAKAIAFDILENNGKDRFSDGAVFYHADYVNPRWNRNMVKITQIETHIFYKHK